MSNVSQECTVSRALACRPNATTATENQQSNLGSPPPTDLSAALPSDEILIRPRAQLAEKAMHFLSVETVRLAVEKYNIPTKIHNVKPDPVVGTIDLDRGLVEIERGCLPTTQGFLAVHLPGHFIQGKLDAERILRMSNIERLDLGTIVAVYNYEREATCYGMTILFEARDNLLDQGGEAATLFKRIHRYQLQQYLTRLFEEDFLFLMGYYNRLLKDRPDKPPLFSHETWKRERPVYRLLEPLAIPARGVEPLHKDTPWIAHVYKEVGKRYVFDEENVPARFKRAAREALTN